MNSAKLAVSLGAVTLALTGITASAATNVVSDPVGFYKIAIPTGPNMISAPLPNISAFKGTVASVSGNNINFSGTPGFTSSAFGPVTVGGMPRGQFLLIVCKDADEIDGSPANVAGDWWVISNNSTTNVTVEPSGDVVGNFVEEGDTVEIRKLTSLKDIFGTGSDYILVKDQNGDLDPLLWDTIDIVVGTTFAETWSYWEIPGFPEFNGYGGPDSALDGSQITLLPNQPVVVNRLASAGATNACVLGQVQVKPFTHYLDEGATAVTMVFAASQQVALSKLAEAPNFAPDVDGDQTPSDSVIVSEVNGTVFTPVMSFFEIPGFPELDGWFDGVNTQSTEELDPTKGYIISVPFGNGTIRWRQPAPYSL